MKHLLSFEEFVNENYKIQEASDADGFDPTKGNVTDPEKAPVKASTGKSDSEVFSSDQDPDKMAGKVASISDMKPGKEYVLTVDGKKHTDMLYQGVTDGVHIFNGEDKAHDVTLTDSELSALISKGGAVEVDE
jgi:hypothetical protein